MYGAEENEVEEREKGREACCDSGSETVSMLGTEFQLTACYAYMALENGPYLGIHEIPGDIR